MAFLQPSISNLDELFIPAAWWMRGAVNISGELPCGKILVEAQVILSQREVPRYVAPSPVDNVTIFIMDHLSKHFQPHDPQ